MQARFALGKPSVDFLWNGERVPPEYFGTSTGLTAMKGVEFGETHYEIEGLKNGKKKEVSFDPNGNKE